MLEPNVKVNVKNGVLPNLKGLMGKNIIPQLENQGYRVDYKGVGKIKISSQTGWKNIICSN